MPIKIGRLTVHAKKVGVTALTVSGVREAIERRGGTLMFLPPYSPDLNPIEQVFAKLKAALRKAAPRNREALWQAVGQTLDRFKPDECLNYLVNAGYGRSA